VRTRLTLLLTLILSLLVVVPTAAASPADRWSGPYFGDGNLPPGCVTDMDVSDCYHMRTGLNALDSPKIDVLVVVPVSPFAERDARIQTQAVEMWAGGIDYLAREMGMDWLADTVEFRIAVNHIDLTTGEGTEDFSTYPLWDPEIIVISSNPVGGIGIGIDPLDFSSLLLGFFGIDGTGEGPCHGVQNPFDLSQWQALPGFDDHHGQGTGTYYEEDCDGAGGNVCFAVNGAIDPTPGMDVDYDNPVVNLPFGLFDLVAHEVGHCLTLGHVGDALDHTSKTVPTWDIMAYTDDPPGQTKCVSTLDVEVFATRMSEFIDTTGDGTIGEDNVLLANDQAGDKDPSGFGNAFHVQHPGDHWYASSTGSPWDCPQPDLGVIPGERTQWSPEPARAERVLTVTSPEDGATTDRTVTVTGTVERRHDEDATWNPHTSAGEGASVTSTSSTDLIPSATTTVGTLAWTSVFSPWLAPLGVGDTTSVAVAGGGDGSTSATETVAVYADGALVGSQGVSTGGSADRFAIDATLEAGTHELRIDWEDRGSVVASETRTITVDGGDGGDGGNGAHPSCKPHPKKGTAPPGQDGRC
jgi:hypothetical protein